MAPPTDAAGPSVKARKDAWKRTLGELEAARNDLESDGWDVVAIPVGHTAPQSPDHGDDDRSGLVAVIPGNYVEPFEAAFDAGAFGQYDVLRQEVGGHVFCLLQLFDSPSETAILLAMQFSTVDAKPLVETVRERGRVSTHVQTLDSGYLGAFVHEEPAKFFPNLETSES